MTNKDDSVKAPAIPATREPWTAKQINEWYVENFSGFSPGTEPHGIAYVAFVRLKNLLGIAPEAAAAPAEDPTTTSTSKE